MGIETVNELAELSATRQAQISLQPIDVGGLSPAPTDGVLVTDAVIAMLQVSLREDLRFHGSRVRITTLDLTATYTVNIAGTPVAYDAGAAAATSEADVINGIVNAINVAAVDANALAEARGGSQTVNTVVLSNNTGESSTHTTAVSATGTGAMEFDEDLTALNFRLLVKAKVDSNDDENIPPQGLPWALVNGGVFTALDYRGFAEKIEVNLWDRVYVQTYGEASPTSVANAKPIIAIGPGVTE